MIPPKCSLYLGWVNYAGAELCSCDQRVLRWGDYAELSNSGPNDIITKILTKTEGRNRGTESEI